MMFRKLQGRMESFSGLVGAHMKTRRRKLANQAPRAKIRVLKVVVNDIIYRATKRRLGI